MQPVKMTGTGSASSSMAGPGRSEPRRESEKHGSKMVLERVVLADRDINSDVRGLILSGAPEEIRTPDP